MAYGPGAKAADKAVARPKLAPALAALAQSGCGIAIASRGADGAPVLGLGVACRLRPGGVLRLLVDQCVNAEVVAALASGGPVAVTLTATRDHSSFQVKASAASIVPMCNDDLPEIDRQQALFRDGLSELGYSAAQGKGYSVYQAANLVSVEFTPEQVFSQTPGPGAGQEITE
jgi:hypothetical protein